jgi:hypothetical protein
MRITLKALSAFTEEKEVLYASDTRSDGRRVKLWARLDGHYFVRREDDTLYGGRDAEAAVRIFNEA